MVEHQKLHEVFDISRSSLYYKSKKYEEDLKTKQDIEEGTRTVPNNFTFRVEQSVDIE